MVRSSVSKALSCSKLNGLRSNEAFSESGKKDACRKLFYQSYVQKLDYTFVVVEDFLNLELLDILQGH